MVVGFVSKMAETYLKVKGKWFYLYRAVDKTGIDAINLQLALLFILGRVANWPLPAINNKRLNFCSVKTLALPSFRMI